MSFVKRSSSTKASANTRKVAPLPNTGGVGEVPKAPKEGGAPPLVDTPDSPITKDEPNTKGDHNTEDDPIHLEDKDTLAYERERQRYKRTIERARKKAKKVFGANAGAAVNMGRGVRALQMGNRIDTAMKYEWNGGKERVKGGGIKKGGDVERDGGADEKGEPVGGDVDEEEYSEKPAAVKEVKLADLVLIAPSSKSKKVRGLGEDFEFVPHVRSVIVLDERTRELDVDEAWECVEHENNKSVPLKASYARVAASAQA